MSLSYSNFDTDVLRAVIAEQPREFYTDAVISDARVRRLHNNPGAGTREGDTYRRMVGRHMRRIEDALEIDWVRFGRDGTGSLWRKRSG